MPGPAAENPFFYIASKAGGGRSCGVRQARSPRALSDSLRREKKILLKSQRLPAFLASESKMTLKDHAEMNTQLAQLVSRGVPLVEALDVTAQTVHPRAKGKVSFIRQKVASGSSFADACRAAGGFDTVTTAVYRAAERTGDLAGACEQLARSARRRLAISGKAGTLMLYPAIVATIGTVVAAGMLMFIVPRIGEALTEFAAQSGTELPWYTTLMMSLGLWLREFWWIVLLALLGLVVLGLIARREVASVIGVLSRKSPVMGDLVLAQESARFFGVMAAMTRAGVPLADALAVGVRALNHPQLRKQLDTVQHKLVAGGVLIRLIEHVEAFPLATRRLLIAADKAGDLESAFDALADDMQDLVEKRSERLLATLEPLLLVLLFLVIGSLVLSIMIPMIRASAQSF